MAIDQDIELTKAGGEQNVVAHEADEAGKARSQQPSGGVLDRYINLVSTINFSFVLQSSWVGAAATFQFGLLNGGPASLAWGAILAGVGTTLTAISLAELASMDPTVGAQYRWSATHAPKHNRFWGLMQGWITVFGWISTCASTPALVTNMIMGLAGFNNPEYVPQRWHFTLIMCGLVITPFLANFWVRKILNPLESIGAIVHVVFFIVSIVTLVTLAERSTADYVFNTLTNDLSGWSNPAVAFGIGLLTVVYPLTSCDGVLHMSDEVRKARVRIPRSMIIACVFNSIEQFAFIVTVLFCIGDVERVSASPLPIIEVYYQATGSKAATNVFIVALIFIVYVSFFNCFASVSRLLWAFARDNGLPFAPTFARVHPKLRMPVNSLCLIGVCLCLLAIINIGSSTAFNALISLPALSQYISYFIPVFFILLRRLSRERKPHIPWGPFTLGRWGVPINVTALAYMLYIIIWLPFPSFNPVDAVNMNYAGPIMGAITVGALIDWCVTGHKRFQVPVAIVRPDFD